MAVFNKKRNLLEDNNNLMGMSSRKNSNVRFSSAIKPEGQMQSSQRARDIFSSSTLYGQPISRQSTKKGVRIQPQIRPTQTKTTQPTQPTQTQMQMPQTQQTQMQMQPSFTENISSLSNEAVRSARESADLARQLYSQQAPEILGSYEQQIANYGQQQRDIQAQMEQARQQEAQNKAMIEQQYGQQVQQATTASEADLRRAAEARRIQQAQLEQKFANLGTLGSTGYFGQTGETQRSESEFLRGQQDIMAQRQATVNDINNQKNVAIMNAQNNINNILTGYQQQINDLNNNITIAYRDKVKMANDLYANLEQRLTDIDRVTRDELATYNKQLFDIEQENIRSQREIERENIRSQREAEEQRLKGLPTPPTILELRNTEDALNLVETILQEGNLGSVTGRPLLRFTGIRPGGLRTETLLNTLLDKLTVEARKSLKGQGTITDREVEMLRNAILPEKGQAGLTESDLRAMLTVIGNRLNQDYVSGTQMLNQAQMQQPTMGTSNFTIVEVQ